jgi:hypothetical protein
MKEDGNSIDCAQFEEIVHELERPETRGPELREAALIHAESCGRCAVLLTETESLDFALTRIADEAERNAIPARMEVSLLQEFRRVKAESTRRRVERQFVAVGSAAALFLALGVTLRHHSATLKAPEAGTQATVNVPAPGPDAAASGVQRNGQIQPTTQRKTAKAVTDDPSDELELAENFTPLPYADDPSMIEDGAVVRVVLSRSALVSLGVSVADVGSSEQVPADLVVSADGTPEAIRLVSQNVE